MYLVNRALGEKPGKVVFSSFNGSAYSDNPRSISEALAAARADLELVWLFERPQAKAGRVPKRVRSVRFGSLRALYELATASAWVDNTTKPPYVYKSPRQFYMQTWHGDRGFKTILLDSPNYASGRRMVERQADVMLTGSAHAERVCRSAFGYEGELLKCGSPRNDILFAPDAGQIAQIRAALGVPEGAKVLLYAPTYRRAAAGAKEQPVELDVARTLDALEAKSKGGWVCLMRGHTKVGGLSVIAPDRRAIDATDWEDMAELLLISDALISDYSSSVGDFALTGRPIFLFQPDYAEFSEERTFYFDIDASPFIVARDQQALERRILAHTPEDAARNGRDILAFFDAYETGCATESAANAVLCALNRHNG